MNICFLINDWNSMNPETETTITLIQECCRRGHRVAVVYPQNLTVRNNMAYGFMKIVSIDRVPEKPILFYRKADLTDKMLPLKGFDVIFLRKNPPVDSIMLNFLDAVKNDVFIINTVEGVRTANNKLYTSTFSDPDHQFLPDTYVSKNIPYLKKTILEHPGDKMILKPLDGYGGSGVIVLEKSAPSNLNSLLDFYVNGRDRKNYVMIQEYIEGAENGDIRVLMLNGKPIGAYRRVPAKGDIRSNIHAGGSAEKHTLSAREKEICRKIGKKLVSDGIYFAGLDIIGDKLIEVNVQSPGGIVNINRLNRTRLQRKVIDFLESISAERNDAISKSIHTIRRKEAILAEMDDAGFGNF